MTLESYADVLKLSIQMQIEYIREEMEEPFADEEHLNSVIVGLMIALDKIEASKFLWNK